ncbi:MAG: M20/M25/M40 family metallo-hydrolase [Gammaproteobacteria bacterium]
MRSIIVLILACVTCPAAAADSALDRLKRYVEVDTTNPPGNESRGVAFFADIFEQAGIEYATAESAPGRGNIWARLAGADAPGLVLLHHIDVVPATAAAWDSDPLKAEVRDGKLYGRGTLDTKGLGITHLQAFLALHESGQPLARDVIFVATADEEAGGLLGAGWLLEHHPEIFERAGFLLNEGGVGIDSGSGVAFRIEVAQKRPYWVRLTASDKPGHGSSPYPTSAPGRLVAALERIRRAPFAPRVVAPVRTMFQATAALVEDPWAASFRDIDRAVSEPGFLERLQAAKPRLHALLRNTCALTMLSGSGKVNVVPPTASAELDCRILPDQDAAQFHTALVDRVGDEHITVERTLSFGPGETSTDTALFRQLVQSSQAHYPGAGVVPAVAGGFTDSHFFRERGIASYGYAPFVVPTTSLAGVHGNNEHIPIAAFERGVELMTDIVFAFAGATRP